MPNSHETKPIPDPPDAPTTADAVSVGASIPAIERIRLFSDVQWEEFILEWAHSLKDKYTSAERCGGAGDMGRDVVAVYKDDEECWDNYQCKHYATPLTPTNIWLEIGKLAYYTERGDFTLPTKYFFVSPQGLGTKLSNLLKKPDDLRQGLANNWNGYCLKQITGGRDIPLEGSLSDHLEKMDFSIFESVPPLRLLDQHAATRWHVARFGGGLPQRPAVKQPPASPATTEAKYVRKLLDAYSERLNYHLSDCNELNDVELREHFDDSRLEFYSAESLRAFSRDTLPRGEFERLQDEFYNGIRDQVRAAHSDGYCRVLAVVAAARALQITSHPLVSRMAVRDRGGVCHQLANNDKFKWVR